MSKNHTNPSEYEVVTLGGGCFWCLEAVYEQLQGVEKSVSGFAGGTVANPSYEEVVTGSTGHAEVIQLTINPKIISYREILEIFFTIHDPTTLNRQGPDVGTQYRSIILYHSDGQKKLAEEVIAEMEAEKIWNKPIVTELVEFSAFYPAEEYHQEYYRKNPYLGYCRVIISPKVAKFRNQYLNKLKSSFK